MFDAELGQCGSAWLHSAVQKGYNPDVSHTLSCQSTSMALKLCVSTALESNNKWFAADR
jgi:hypothetical protein